MPTTKSAPKSNVKTDTDTAPEDTPPINVSAEGTVESNGSKAETKAEKEKRVSKVTYAFGDEGGDVEVADELPEQEKFARNTSGLVGRTSIYVGFLTRIKDEFAGKWVRLAKFENAGAATVARNELLGREVKSRKTGEMVKSKQRELPEGTTVADWEVEVRRVNETDEETGESKRVSQLWVKYVGS